MATAPLRASRRRRGLGRACRYFGPRRAAPSRPRGRIRRLFVVAVDDPANASAYSAAIVRRAPLTVAISSSGATPALTRLLREVIEEVLPHPDWIAHAQALRTEWLASAKPMGERFADLVRELANRAK